MNHWCHKEWKNDKLGEGWEQQRHTQPIQPLKLGVDWIVLTLNLCLRWWECIVWYRRREIRIKHTTECTSIWRKEKKRMNMYSIQLKNKKEIEWLNKRLKKNSYWIKSKYHTFLQLSNHNAWNINYLSLIWCVIFLASYTFILYPHLIMLYQSIAP